MDFDDQIGRWLEDKNCNNEQNENIAITLENQLLNGIRLFNLD